jgi:hypothetical protein
MPSRKKVEFDTSLEDFTEAFVFLCDELKLDIEALKKKCSINKMAKNFHDHHLLKLCAHAKLEIVINYKEKAVTVWYFKEEIETVDVDPSDLPEDKSPYDGDPPGDGEGDPF